MKTELFEFLLPGKDYHWRRTVFFEFVDGKLNDIYVPCLCFWRVVLWDKDLSMNRLERIFGNKYFNFFSLKKVKEFQERHGVSNTFGYTHEGWIHVLTMFKDEIYRLILAKKGG